MEDKKYLAREQANTILRSLQIDRKSGGESCDVQLKCEEKIFKAHKYILSGASEYFKKLFYNDMKEKYEETIEMKMVSPEILGQVLDFIYTAEIKLSTQNMFDLLAASEYMLLKDLSGYCVDFITSCLECDNAITFWLRSRQYNTPQLTEKCGKFVREHFAEIETSEIFQLDKNSFKEFLSMRTKKCGNEEAAFSFILQWVEQNPDERKKLFLEFFSSLNLKLIKAEFLIDNVCNEDIVRQSLECLQKINMDLKHFALKPRLSHSVVAVNENATVYKLIDYDLESETVFWKQREPLQNASFIIRKSLLYQIGGLRNGRGISDVFTLDFNFPYGGWKNIPSSLQCGRYNAGVTTLNDKIYVFGGKSNTESDVLYVETIPQSKITLCKECSTDVVCYSGDLYAISYYDKTIERYVVGSQNTTFLKKLPENCVKILVVEIHTYILRTSDWTPVLSVAKYNLLSGDMTDVIEINDVQLFHDACTVHGKIFVSFTNASVMKPCIYAYDPMKKSWQFVIQSDDADDYRKLVSTDKFVPGEKNDAMLSSEEEYVPVALEHHLLRLVEE